ncbi:MAG: aldose 1-epimerase family protein [Clostridia bacterium]|nr:aldose 1-epimerase family protein [Clostridia bacterium]
MTTIKNEYLTVMFKSKGAEIASVKNCEGKEYIWCGDPDVWAGQTPVLFPICGGLMNDKFSVNGKEYTLEKHGFARHMEFECEKAEDNEAVFCLRDTEETLKQYPFHFEFRIIYTLSGKSIKVTYETKNLNNETMYFSVGGHEGYACPEGIEEYSICFDKPQTLERVVLNGNYLSDKTERVIADSDTLPLKYDYFESDALVFKNVEFEKAALVKNDGTSRIEVSFPGHKYFLIWTKPGAKYICLEPWCGIPDGENAGGDISRKEGIISVEAGEINTVYHTINFN